MIATPKVFQVVECGGPGGTGEQVAAICNGLDPERFEVSLVYAVRSGTPEDYRAKCPGARFAYHVPEMTREISPGRDVKALQILRRIFIERRPNAVHAHSSKAGALARAAAALAGVPRVFYSPRGYAFQMGDRSAASRALYRAAEIALSRIGEIVAVSPSEAALAARLARRPVHTVCDAYLGDFPGPLPHDGLIVGSCGRVSYARDPDAWVLLVQRLTDSRDGLRGLWIGGGEDEARLKRRLLDMNLGAKAEVTGWLPTEQARERLRGLDVFVHYSRWEGLPNAVLEAMAAGLPVVASDVPGNRDAVQDGITGFLVKSEVELLERCQLLTDDASLRRRLGAAARDRVRRDFSRGRMIAELSRLYAA
ncbi:MAG: glycosyltransferase [Elusimicrobia bacterium]|nr:glycosyltransferase [Elusimicrobiota bacterium]